MKMTLPKITEEKTIRIKKISILRCNKSYLDVGIRSRAQMTNDKWKHEEKKHCIITDLPI